MLKKISRKNNLFFVSLFLQKKVIYDKLVGHMTKRIKITEKRNATLSFSIKNSSQKLQFIEEKALNIVKLQSYGNSADAVHTPKIRQQK